MILAYRYASATNLQDALDNVYGVWQWSASRYGYNDPRTRSTERHYMRLLAQAGTDRTADPSETE